MKKVLIFASGNGSNFEAIVEYFKNEISDGAICFELLTDKENAGAIERAMRLGVKHYFVRFKDTHGFLKDKDYDLYILAGYMRILPENVLNLGTFINIHPSLLPKFKGLNAIEQAYDANEIETGVSVHFVVPEVDSGEIIMQKSVEIKSNMTLEQLEIEVHKIEHEIYPKVIKEMLTGVTTNSREGIANEV